MQKLLGKWLCILGLVGIGVWAPLSAWALSSSTAQGQMQIGARASVMRLQAKLATLQSAMEKQGNRGEALESALSMVYVWLELGRFDLAQNGLRSIMQSYPNALTTCAQNKDARCLFVKSLVVLFDPKQAKTHEKARLMLIESADIGDSFAMSYLGWCLWSGQHGFAVSPKSAEKRLKNATGFGNGWAFWLLGNLYAQKSQNMQKMAYDYWVQAARRGHIQAFLTLAEFHLQRDADSHRLQGEAWLKLGAELAWPEAMVRLATWYSEQNQIKKQFFWLQKAAKYQDVHGMRLLGRFLMDTQDGDLLDPKEGFAWLVKAAKKGHTGALLDIVTALKDGHGVEKDEKTARLILEKLSANDNLDAQFVLAGYYAEGVLVEKNQSTARIWYERCAKLGHIEAQVVVGRWYMQGIGGEENQEKARVWLTQAAKAGHPEGAYVLGVWHLQHFKEENKRYDFNQYIHWIVVSADLGYPVGQVELAELYSRDPKYNWIAHAWLQLAEMQGFGLAKVQRQSILLDLEEKQTQRGWMEQCKKQLWERCSEIPLPK